MAGINLRVGGAWKPVKAIWARVNGAWVPVKKVSARHADIWKAVWSSIRVYVSGNMTSISQGGNNYYDRGVFSVASIPAGATVSGHQWSFSDSGGLLSAGPATGATYTLTGPTYYLFSQQIQYSYTVYCSAIVNGTRMNLEPYSGLYTTRGDI